MPSYVLSASRAGVGSVVATGSAAAIAALVVGIGVVVEAGSAPAPGAGAGGSVTAHHISRRRIVQMVNDNPRLARKLGIRGKLQILD
jgi:hypothetical protein